VLKQIFKKPYRLEFWQTLFPLASKPLVTITAEDERCDTNELTKAMSSKAADNVCLLNKS